MRRKRTDSIHQEIREALRQLGYEVIDTSQYGAPLLDLLAIHGGCAYFIEIKSRRGKLSPWQADLIAKNHYAVVMRSTEDVNLFINDYNALRQKTVEALS